MAEPDSTSAPAPLPPLTNPAVSQLQLQTPNTRKNVRVKYLQKFMSPTDAITSPCTEKMNAARGTGAKGGIVPQSTIKEVPEAKNLQF